MFSDIKKNSSFYLKILAIALPLMFQQLVTSSVNLVDNLMVGELGDYALNGVAAANRYYMIAFYGINGVMAAAAVFLAQYYGANKEDKMKETFRIAIIGGILLAIPFIMIGLFIPEVVIGFFNNNELIVNYGVEYLRIVCIQFIPIALILAFAGSMRAVGDTKTPLYASVVSVLVNTVLNYVLIFGKFGFPQLGVAGAAIATLIARIVECILLILILANREYPFATKISELFNFSKQLVVSIIKKGAPLAANELLWSSGMAMLLKFYATRGVEVMAGYAISGTISDLFFTLFGGMAAATTVLVSQPLGANEKETARDNAYRLLRFSIMLAIAFGVLIFSSSYLVPYLYTNVTVEARHIASTFLKIVAFFFFIYMYNTECYFILRAGGDMKSTLYMDSGFMWLVNIPVVALVTYFTDFPIFYLYIAGQLTDLIKLAVGRYMVGQEKWLVNLTHQEAIEILDS